ncbi:MAG TPA: transglutaminase family protein [Nannocystaceae bacterium]|nr:transglutaminase family protein [Nannocystaceae bacterium]
MIDARRRLIDALGLAFAMCIVACASTRATSSPAEVERAYAAARNDELRARSIVAPALAAAEVAQARDDHEAAATFAGEAQRAARLDAAIAHVRGDAAERGTTQRRWRKASRRARAHARRAGGGEALVDAVRASPRPQLHVRALRDGIRAMWAPPWDLEELGPLAERPRVQVERLRGEPLAADREWLTSFDELPKRSRRDAQLGERALQAAVTLGRPRAEIVARAQALLDRDRWHVPARLVVAIDRERRAGRLRGDRWVWRDLVDERAWADTSVIVRMQRRLAAGDHPLWRLALAHALVRAGLFGDAAAVLEVVGAPTLERDTFELVAALTNVALDRSDAIAKWRKRHDEPSRWLDTYLAELDHPTRADKGVRAVGAVARRAFVASRERGRLTQDLAVRTSLDPDARPRLRRIARRELAERPSVARIEAQCRRDHTSADACAELVALQQWNPSGERIDALPQLAAADALYPGIFGSSTPPPLKWLDHSRNRPTAAHVLAEVTAADRRGDRRAARAILERRGELLPITLFVAATLALEGDDPFAPDSLHDLLPSLDELRYDWELEWEPSGANGAVVRALYAIGDGAACDAMPPLRQLEASHRGRVAAWLAVYGAWAALECGDASAFDWFIGRVQAGAPDSAIAYALRGEQLARKKDTDGAVRWFVAALARDADVGLAYDGLARWAEGNRDLDVDDLRKLFAASASGWRWQHSDLLRVLAARKKVRRADVLAIRALIDNEKVERPERLVAIDPELGRQVYWVLDRELDRATDPATARKVAARMLALITLLDDRGNVLQGWVGSADGLAFLLGREPIAISSVDDDTLRLGRSASDEHLLRARTTGALDDAQAFLMWRKRWRWSPDGTAVDELYQRILAEPWTLELRAYACEELIQAERWADAVKQCRAAWQASRDPVLAAATAQAIFAGEKPDLALLRELFADEPPRFPATEDPELARWWAARARDHEMNARDDDAAAAWLDAIALEDLRRDDDWRQLGARGISIRHAELRGDPPDPKEMARLAFLALMGCEVDVARRYARAALAITGDSTRELRHRAAHRLAFIDLVAADLERGVLDRDAVIEGASLMYTTADASRYEAFATAHPQSLVARAVEVEFALGNDELARARTGVAALQELDGKQPLVAVLAMRTAIASGEIPRARLLFVAARTRSHHPVLDTLVLPESVRGREPDLPQWLRERRTVHRQLAAATLDDDAPPTRRLLLEHDLELWAPPTWTPNAEQPLVLDAPEGWSIAIEPRSRASRCSGAACLQQLRGELESDGTTVLWAAPIETGAGPGTEVAAVYGDEAMLITQIPRGGREFRIVARAPREHLEHTLATLELVRDSFRPLDGVIAGFRAESLRKEAPPLDDAIRLDVRVALAHEGSARCPIAGVLARLDAPKARESALVDAWLASHALQQRLGLTECAKAGTPEAGGIAVLALIDDDERVHAWGRAAVQANPERARATARTLFSTALEPALAHPDHLRRRDLPPRGLLELLDALPLDHATAMVAELIASPHDRDRSLGFAAAGLRPALLTNAKAMELVRSGDVRSAALAIDWLDETIGAPELAAIRARVDALRPVDAPSRELMVIAVGALADHGGREDLPRMRRAAASVVVPADATDELKFTRRVLDLLVEAMSRPRENPRRAPVPSPTTAARSRDALAKDGLAKLLPGRDWFYARVSNPRLVWTTARRTLARLSGGDASRQMVGEMVKNLLERAGTNLLADDSGIDLSREIECASNPTISAGQVCSAWVTDRARVLTLLGERDFGEDDGLVLPLSVAEGFAKAPQFLSVLPLALPGILVSEDSPPDRPLAFSERVRGIVDIEEYRLHSSLIVRGRADGVDIDEEYYLFVGDRMYAFTTRRLANAVLGRGGPTLAEDPEFATLVAKLHGDAGIVGASLGEAADGAASTIELAIDDRGLRFRQLVRNEARVGDAARVLARLPSDAAATWAVGADAPREELGVRTGDGSEGAPPPRELSQTKGAIAFAWVPAPGAGLWHDWVVVLEPTADDLKRLGKAKLVPRAGKVARPGVHVGARDGLVVWASTAALRDRALAGTSSTANETRTVAHGSFRGAASAAAVEAAKSGSVAFRRFIALALEVVESADYDASADPSAGVLALDGKITLSLAKDDRPTDVVDAWLAARDDTNAILLPRNLQSKDLGGELTYVLDVVDPESFVQRVLAVSPRITARVEGGKRVRVTVRAQPSAGDRPLSADQTRRMLAATRDYPASAEKIRELVPVIVGKQKDPDKIAAAIVAWVHQRIRYEITPRRVDGAKVLESGRGDCSEYATLTVTLLRAAGVPAEERSGMMASGGDMVAHAWVAYHDGKRWHEVDPTAGTTSVTAGHIEMSVVDLLALDAVGGLTLVAIE